VFGVRFEVRTSKFGSRFRVPFTVLVRFASPPNAGTPNAGTPNLEPQNLEPRNLEPGTSNRTVNPDPRIDREHEPGTWNVEP
jgi:hypothetical protein